MDLRDLAMMLRRQWLFISAAALIGLSCAALLTLTQRPTYISAAAVFVSTENASTAADLSLGSNYTQQIVKSYADVATTPYVLDGVITDLDLHTTSANLARTITASAPEDTVLVSIEVENEQPRQAAAIANAVANTLVRRVADLSPRTTASGTSIKTTVIQQAVPAAHPSKPNWPLNVALGLLVGFLAGVAFQILRSRLDSRIRTPDDVTSASDAPVLGATGFDPNLDRNRLVVAQSATSPTAESYRSIATNLQYLPHSSAGLSFVVTSSVESEGKSTLALNLALALAEGGKRVLLIDGDLRRPSIAAYSGLIGDVGLSDVLARRLPLNRATQSLQDSSVDVLPAGHIPPNPSALLQTDQLGLLLTEAREVYDTVVIDAPPMLPVSDASIIARRTNGVIVTTAARRTRISQLEHTLSSLALVDVPVLGVVITRLPLSDGLQYGYAGAYEYTATPATPA